MARQNPVLSAINSMSNPIQGMQAASQMLVRAGQSFDKGASLALKLDRLFEEEEARLQNNVNQSQQMLMQGLKQSADFMFRSEDANYKEQAFNAAQKQNKFTNELGLYNANTARQSASATSKLANMKATDVFVITDELDKNLELASRNLPRVDVADVAGINPVSLLRNKKVLITKPALEKLGAWLG